MSDSAPTGPVPQLPSLARMPVACMPERLKAFIMTAGLNMLFRAPLAAGELAFLAGRVMNVCISDAGLRFSARLEQGELRVGEEVGHADVTIEGAAYTFLQLATRSEDADTLFFRRQLKTTGDTELGLQVKNFLDGLEPESLPYHRVIDPVLRRGLAIAEGTARIRRRLSGLPPSFD